MSTTFSFSFEPAKSEYVCEEIRHYMIYELRKRQFVQLLVVLPMSYFQQEIATLQPQDYSWDNNDPFIATMETHSLFFGKYHGGCVLISCGNKNLLTRLCYPTFRVLLLSNRFFLVCFLHILLPKGKIRFIQRYRAILAETTTVGKGVKFFFLSLFRVDTSFLNFKGCFRLLPRVL